MLFWKTLHFLFFGFLELSLIGVIGGGLLYAAFPIADYVFAVQRQHAAWSWVPYGLIQVAIATPVYFACVRFANFTARRFERARSN